MMSDEQDPELFQSERKHSVAFTNFAIDNPQSSLAVSCTLLFAMSELFLGIVIPLSDSFVTTSEIRNDEHGFYLEIFLIIQYASAVLSVFYLQGYVYLYDCYKNKNDAKEKEARNGNGPLIGNDAEIDIEKISVNLTQLKRNETDIENISYVEIFKIPTGPSQNSDNLNNDEKSDDSNNKIFSFFNNYYIMLQNNGINLYLRLGAVGFGFGIMVHDGFKIADQVRFQSPHCHNDLWTPKQSLHLAYIFIQTFFVFKYHRTIFLKQRPVIRFILYHLTISNICQWFKTVVYEIKLELIESRQLNKSKDFYGNVSLSIINNTCFEHLSYTVSPYLFPCAIEYSLICAAIFYKMLQRVDGEFSNKSSREKVCNRVTVENVKYSECHRSHKGLFVGLLFFMVTLVGLAIFFLFKKDHKTQTLAVMVYQVSEIILLVSSFIALIAAFIKMRALRFCQLNEKEALDDNLLLIGLSGVFAYNLFLFISTMASSKKMDKNKYLLTTTLFLLKSLTEILQSLLQVLFVLESSRKCAQTFHDVKTKPGRSLVTFLIVTNLALWIISIFEAKRADEHLIFTQYYQKTPWSIITHTLLPLIIFFRFHSSICLTDIWTKAYKMNINK